MYMYMYMYMYMHVHVLAIQVGFGIMLLISIVAERRADRQTDSDNHLYCYRPYRLLPTTT